MAVSDPEFTDLFERRSRDRFNEASRPACAQAYWRGGRMIAPMSQSSGKKIPKKNIQPCPFLNVMTPSVTSRTTYRRAPIPIPHHMRSPLL
jgi:hypothetical protein